MSLRNCAKPFVLHERKTSKVDRRENLSKLPAARGKYWLDHSSVVTSFDNGYAYSVWI